MNQTKSGCGCWFWFILFALIGIAVIGGAFVAVIKLVVITFTVLLPFVFWGFVIVMVVRFIVKMFR